MRRDGDRDGPGYQALRKGRESAEGEWYAVTTCSAGLDLRPIAEVITEQARRLEAEGRIVLHVLVVMPDHCHVLFKLGAGAALDGVVQLLKGRSSFAANRALGRRGSLWQTGFYESLLHTPREAHAMWWYILDNPVRRGLVTKWEDYPHTYTVPLLV